MQQGALKLGNEVIDAEYEIIAVDDRQRRLRQVAGTLRLKERPRAELARAMANMGGAILILDNGRAQSIQLASSPDEFSASFDAFRLLCASERRTACSSV
jgi:hypothetical protein